MISKILGLGNSSSGKVTPKKEGSNQERSREEKNQSFQEEQNKEQKNQEKRERFEKIQPEEVVYQLNQVKYYQDKGLLFKLLQEKESFMVQVIDQEKVVRKTYTLWQAFGLLENVSKITSNDGPIKGQIINTSY